MSLALAFVPGRRTPARAAAATIAALVLVPLLAAAPAAASDDQPTQWQIDARADFLQRAPEPPEKPVICIIDTGVTPTPDLDIVSRTALDGGTPDDVTATPGSYGHGTTVAHMAAAKVNGWGSSGTFPHARIASVRIFPNATDRVPWQRYVTALEWCDAVRPRPVVAVMALGGATSTAEETRNLESVLRKSRDRQGMSVVAAAGNSGADIEMPARLSEAFAVSATDHDGALCHFSARGLAIDVAAPGCAIHQAGWDGGIWSLNGTSFAAPVAAAILAAVRSYTPGWTAVDAEERVRSSAHDGVARTISARAALQHLGFLNYQKAAVLDGPHPEAVPAPAASAAPPAVEQTPRQVGMPDSRRPGPLVTPRGEVIRRAGLSEIRIRNRPSGAVVEIRINGRTLRLRGSAKRLATHARAVHVRFNDGRRRSLWVKLTSRPAITKEQ